MTRSQRSSIGNAIWLCSNCAELIDRDERRFSVELLRQWKATAESLTQREQGKALPSRTELKRLKLTIAKTVRDNRTLVDILRLQGRKTWLYLAAGVTALGVIGAYASPLLWLKDIEEAYIEFSYQGTAAGGYAFNLVNHAPFPAVIDVRVEPFGQFTAETTATMPLDRFIRSSVTAYPYKSTNELRANETRRIRLPPIVPSSYLVAKEAQAKVDLQARPSGRGPFAVIARLVGKVVTTTKKFEILDGQWFESGAGSSGDRRCAETPMDFDCTTPDKPRTLPVGSALNQPTQAKATAYVNDTAKVQCERAFSTLQLPFEVWCSEIMKANRYPDYFACIHSGYEHYESERNSARQIVADCNAGS